MLFAASFTEMAMSQSTLNFPRALTLNDRQTTGFALVNPGAEPAPVSFKLLSSTGTQIAASEETIPARGQLARLCSELFPTGSDTGWVQATSSASGVQGFWLGGDFSSFTDGARAADSNYGQILPLITDHTEINIANTGADSTIVTIRLVGRNGVDIAPAVQQTIPARGVFQTTATSLFPSANVQQAGYVLLNSTLPVAAVSVISELLNKPSWGVINGMDSAAQTTDLYFPHVISGDQDGGSYTTTIGIVNLRPEAHTVYMSFTPQTEDKPTMTAEVRIPARGSIRETLQSIFNLASGSSERMGNRALGADRRFRGLCRIR